MASAALDERVIPGLSLVVLQGDETILAKGYGFADEARQVPVSATTVFQLGSISKQFLSAFVLRLAERGVLSLDDPVIRHLPEFTRLPPEMRVRHLLNHTSGIREPFTFPEYSAGIEDLRRSAEELVLLLRRAPVDFAPGSRWSYSNANYMILAVLVERIAGKSYERQLADEFFQPLGLSSLRPCTPLPQERNAARGHVLQGGAIVPAAPENMNWIRGDGGLCGNALDVAKWTRLLATGRVVTPESYRQMVAPTRLADGRLADYGFGLSLVTPDGRRKVAHNGAMLGVGDPGVRARPLPPEMRRRVVGRYDIGVFELRIVERDGQLWLEMPPPGPTTRLRYLGHGEFACESDPDACRLTVGHRDGPAEDLRIFMGAMHWYGVRLP
ncbi:serine hydrolase domain-containing protein [Sinimarinibacterium thermocellulolyticum]|uniref:Serine hydrolase domain-containing protein n=1 Tax=Sinimarinibacterium thermocellulolyticum TaxID=3170016 RepID=A0ABV2AD95_9GAMM